MLGNVRESDIQAKGQILLCKKQEQKGRAGSKTVKPNQVNTQGRHVNDSRLRTSQPVNRDFTMSPI